MEKSAGAILVIAAGSEDHSKSCGYVVVFVCIHDLDVWVSSDHSLEP